MGKILIIAGVLLFVLGIILTQAPWLLSWFGKLPGDIHYEGENTQVFIPLTSMIILSILLSLVIALFKRF